MENDGFIEYDGIHCVDECFLCKIKWNGIDEISIVNSVMKFCDEHNRMIGKYTIGKNAKNNENDNL